MAQLEDQREELFAQGIAAGKTNKQAALDAGYTDGAGISVTATRKLQLPRVQERIREINNERIKNDDDIADSTEMQRLLTRIIRGEETETIVFGQHAQLFTLPPQVKDRISAVTTLARMQGVLNAPPSGDDGQLHLIAAALRQGMMENAPPDEE